jgi:UDP-glucose 4-epimerase
MLFGLARDVGIDVVAHTAVHRTPGEGGSPRAFQVNATRSLLDLCERHPTIQRVAIRSAAQVYRVRRDLPVLMEEDHPINLAPGAQKWVQDRVEADLTACTRMGMSNTQIVVLRMAEVLAPGTGSQLFDYLESPVCLLPLGFDPMLNVLTIEDAVDALARAIHSEVEGIINIPGADTLPLTASIRRWGRVGIPLPETLLDPLYWLRGLVTGHDFRYRQNRRRFHYSGVLDGARARQLLGYVPKHPVTWPAWTAPTEAASG